MANRHKFLTALNTSLDKNNKVMKLAKRTFSPPRLDFFQCHIVFIWVVVFEALVVGNKEEGFGGEVDNMALAAKSVRFRIILDIKFTEKVYKSQLSSEETLRRANQEKGVSSLYRCYLRCPSRNIQVLKQNPSLQPLP